MSADTILQWRPEYSVGIAEIDAQHRRLFEMADDLARKAAAGTGEREMREIIAELNDYVIGHFSLEEQILKAAGYEHFDEHVSMHEMMAVRLALLEKNLKAGKLLPQELEEFMESWLTEHIIMEDMRYIPAVAAMPPENRASLLA